MASRNIFGEPILWRYTMRSPRLSIFDARLIFLFVPLLFHFRIWSVILLFAGIVVFAIIERAGLRFPSALRGIRSRLAGRSRPARPRSHYRTAIDFGFETNPLTALPEPTLKAEKQTKAATEKRHHVKRRRRRRTPDSESQPAESSP